MSSGLDRLPGHAYAPGFEPGWFDVAFSWEQGGGADSFMLMGLVGTLIFLVLVRLLVSAPRLKTGGVRQRRHGLAASTAAAGADFTQIAAHTLTDPNFACQPKRRQTAQAAEEDDS